MKATHRGHCQLCGSLQKLPSGVLSLHGYTVASGFFSGVCRGAKALPFEESYELVDREVARAQSELDALMTKIRVLRTHVNSDTKMWVRTYVKSDYTRRSYYIWEPVTLFARFETDSANNYTRIVYSYTEHGGKDAGGSSSGFHGVKPYERPTATCEELRRATVLQYNNTYADWLQHEATSLQRYIVWQRDRVTNWHAQSLLPLDGKLADVSFKPEPAPY